MTESTVTVKGQTTLPKEVRQALTLQPGDRIRYFVLDGGEVRISRSRAVTSLAGLLKGQSDRRVSIDEMNEAVEKGALDK